MGSINWTRVILCGLLAGGVWTLLSVILLALVGGDFLAAVTGGRQHALGSGVHVFLLSTNLLAGIWAMWLYAAIRPHYGPGPKTAVIAGFAWWVIVSMQSAKWVALVSGSPTVVAPLVATLPAVIVAALLGAWPYEE